MNEGKPFSGVFWDHIQNTLTRFEGGLLNGLKEYFDGNNKLTKSEPYINGTIEGEVTFYFNNKEYRCIYTKGNPFEGTILNEKNELVTFHEGKPY